MYAYARDVAECTWVEEAVLYIDALPVFLKIVVGLREKWVIISQNFGSVIV